LRDGLVEQIGSPTELYDRPVNTFVAAFIGSPSMNLLAGTVTSGTIAFDEGSRLALGGQQHAQEGDKVTIGVRPEDFRVVQAGAPGSLAAEVKVTEFTGADTQLVCTANGQEVIVVLHQRVSAQVGDKLGLIVDGESMHLFDTASGKRLG